MQNCLFHCRANQFLYAGKKIVPLYRQISCAFLWVIYSLQSYRLVQQQANASLREVGR